MCGMLYNKTSLPAVILKSTYDSGGDSSLGFKANGN